MAKITKKAFLEVDIISAIVIIIFLFILILSLQFIKTSSFDVTSYKQKLNNDLMFINLLRAETPEGNLKDTILLDYAKEDYDNTKEELNKILIEAFGEKICWNMIIDNKIINEKKDCKEMEDIEIGEIDALLYIPYEGKQGIKQLEVRLRN